MSGRQVVRSAAQRVVGVPDATEVGASLEQLRAELAEVRESLESLRNQHEAARAEVGRELEELAALRAAVLDQARAIDEILGRLDGGAAGRNQQT